MNLFVALYRNIAHKNVPSNILWRLRARILLEEPKQVIRFQPRLSLENTPDAATRGGLHGFNRELPILTRIFLSLPRAG